MKSYLKGFLKGLLFLFLFLISFTVLELLNIKSPLLDVLIPLMGSILAIVIVSRNKLEKYWFIPAFLLGFVSLPFIMGIVEQKSKH